MVGIKLLSAVNPQMIKNNARNVFRMQTKQKEIREDNFYFPKYSMSISQTGLFKTFHIKSLHDNQLWWFNDLIPRNKYFYICWYWKTAWTSGP